MMREKVKFWTRYWWIVCYYLLSFLIIWLGEKLGPSGGHSPGLGALYAIGLFPLITLALVIASLVCDFDRGLPSFRTLTHVILIVLFIIWLANFL